MEYPPDTLGMTADEMQRLGYRVVDLVVQRLCGKSQEAVIKKGSRKELEAAIGTALPEQPQDVDDAIQLLAEVVLMHQQHSDHPRYFARVPSPSSFAAVLGEWLGTGFNAIASSWGGGSGTAAVELIVVDWLRQLLGMPKGTEGILVSGGSAANLTALGAARAEYGPGVAYLTDQTHSSIARGFRALGFPAEHIKVMQSDDQHRMRIDTLRNAMDADRDEGRRPLVVVASAGTTNTGAVDPLPELARICKQQDVWFHVDGAYGAPAALCEQGRNALAGMELADSLAVDPHKWLFQPYDIGCILVRRPGALEKAYSMTPEYLKDVHAEADEVDLRNRSLELSRRSRALKLWLTFQAYGEERMRAAIFESIQLAEFAQKTIESQPETWQLVTPAQLGIVTFRFADSEDGDHQRAAAALVESGYAAVTSTNLRGQSVLRLCIINPLTTESDIEETLRRLVTLREKTKPSY